MIEFILYVCFDYVNVSQNTHDRLSKINGSQNNYKKILGSHYYKKRFALDNRPPNSAYQEIQEIISRIENKIKGA